MRHGFSLIELLVVFSIVSFLALVILVNAQFAMDWVFEALGKSSG